MEKYRSLIVIGDPFEDIYCKTENKKTIEYECKPGGASNTFENAVKILSKKQDLQKLFIPNMKFQEKSIYRILRLNDKEDIHLCTEDQRYNYYKDLKYWIQRQLNLTLEVCTPDSVIIFSDYNRGVLSTNVVKYKGLDPLSVGIFDTKYRSIGKGFLEFVKIKIFRCTGKEYEKKFASQFDYTIWTDGPKEIKLLSKDQEIIQVFKNNTDIEAVDTCGAGDTFTAAVGAYLTQQKTTIENICAAIQFAQKCSQDVITKEKTSVTNIIL